MEVLAPHGRGGMSGWGARRNGGALRLTLSAPSTPLLRIHLRWKAAVSAGLRLLGDAWERSYGELGWRQIVPERPMPWYFLAFDGKATHGYGVCTGAAALAFWQCDREGVSLWLDVRNGGRGVLLGQRSVEVATVVAREGEAADDPFRSAQALCRTLAPAPLFPKAPVYGSKRLVLYAYGNSSADDILRDADLMAELAPGSGPRPFTVIDEGWENNPRFASMPEAGWADSAQRCPPGPLGAAAARARRDQQRSTAAGRALRTAGRTRPGESGLRSDHCGSQAKGPRQSTSRGGLVSMNW